MLKSIRYCLSTLSAKVFPLPIEPYRNSPFEKSSSISLSSFNFQTHAKMLFSTDMSAFLKSNLGSILRKVSIYMLISSLWCIGSFFGATYGCTFERISSSILSSSFSSTISFILLGIILLTRIFLLF